MGMRCDSRRLAVYQEFHGTRIAVAGRYTVRNSTRVSFALGAYDTTLPLVIDPVLQATAFQSQNGYYGEYGFLTKLAADGSALVYSTYLAGSSNVAQSCFGQPCWPAPFTSVNGIAVDADGNAYATGSTNTYDFPVTEGACLGSNTSTYNQTVGFVRKFDPSGSLVCSTYFGALPNTYYLNLAGVAVDSDGSAYVVVLPTPTRALFPLPVQTCATRRSSAAAQDSSPSLTPAELL